MGILKRKELWLGLILGWLFLPLVLPSPLHGVVPGKGKPQAG